MIAGIASLVFIPLLAISLVHLLWAFGSTWPAGDRDQLASAVTGKLPMQARWWSFLVGLFVLATGIWALALSDPSTDMILRGTGLVLAVIYGARGIVGYLPAWQANHSAEPFARLNRRLYSPLCLAVALGFVYLSVWPLI